MTTTAIVLNNTKSRLRQYLDANASRPLVLRSAVFFAQQYRTLALADNLSGGSAERFAALLGKASQLQSEWCKAAAIPGDDEPMLRAVSRAYSIMVPLAAGQLGIALEIAKTSPAQKHAAEYEEDFYRTRFFHKLFCKLHVHEEYDLTQILAPWEAIVGSGSDYHLQACLALLARDSKAFNNALQDLLRENKERAASDKDADRSPEWRLTDGRLYLPGLAYLRLAEISGMRVRASYPQIPASARIPAPAAVLPPDAWKMQEQI